MTDSYSTDVDDFLAHYGVLGMHWGQRKAEKQAAKAKKARAKERELERDQAKRREIMKGKDLDEIIARSRKEKKLEKLVEEDLHPHKVAGKKFTNDLLSQNGLSASGLALSAVSIAAGVGFMALRLNRKFSGISTSFNPHFTPGG